MKLIHTSFIGQGLARIAINSALLVLAFAFTLPQVHGQDGITKFGTEALDSNTTGDFNTAHGYRALTANTTGSSNTAVGADALFTNIGGIYNTAVGDSALYFNTGNFNTAIGFTSLQNNTTGSHNSATGVNALYSNKTGRLNTATGVNALFRNSSGIYGTACGSQALFSNTTGNFNSGFGLNALYYNTTGASNTAAGYKALLNNKTGRENIALGANAGINLTTGSFNIDIGHAGVPAETNTIRIGTVGTQTAAFFAGIFENTSGDGVRVFVNSAGKLAVPTSSRRFKEQIKPMDQASDDLLALKPVTFRYKKDVDPKGAPQFGLIAEEVEKVNPDLVVRDAEGKVHSVRYEAIDAMLLNEFLKAHRKIEEQQATITQLASAVAEQRKGMDALSARVKEQDSKIQQVSRQRELNSSTPELAVNP